MVVGFTVSRMNEGHLVNLTGEVRKNLRDLLSGLPVGIEGKGGGHEAAHLVGEEAREAVESLNALPVTVFELGFEVPRIDVALPPIHEQPDDAFGPGSEVSGAWPHGLAHCFQRIRRLGRSREHSVLMQEINEGKQAHAGPASAKHLPARDGESFEWGVPIHRR